jgi:hypothetical protein
MLIINKYLTTTPTPVVITDNNNAVTGNQSQRWGGINPVVATGATGNAAAAEGATEVAAVATYDDQIISKFVEIDFTGVLTAAQPNYVKASLETLGIMGAKIVRGFIPAGVYDANATNTGVTPTPSLIGSIATISIVKDALVVKIAAANIALFQNKKLSIILLYSN